MGETTIPPLTRRLADGSVVRLAPMRQRVVDMKGRELVRPRIGVRLVYDTPEVVDLPTGRLIVGDAVINSLHDGVPLRQVIDPGRHSATAVYAESSDGARRIAFSVLQVGRQPAARYRLALTEDEDPDEITEDMEGGIPVDYGMVAVIDAGCSAELRSRYADAPDGFERQLDEVCVRDRPWGVCLIDGQIPVVVWCSGYGDGLYTAYWGYAADGSVSSLVVDYNVIENGLRGPTVRAGRVGETLAIRPRERPRWRFWR